MESLALYPVSNVATWSEAIIKPVLDFATATAFSFERRVTKSMGDSFTLLSSFISGATTSKSSPRLSSIAFLNGEDEARMSDTERLKIVK